MKKSKIMLILLSFLSLSSLDNLNAKIYTTIDGKKFEQPNVFDVGIFIEEVDSDGFSCEEKKAKNGNLIRLVVINDLKTIINDEEAFIVSTPLMRGLIAAASKEVKNKIQNTDLDFLKELKKLNTQQIKDGQETISQEIFKQANLKTYEEYKNTYTKLDTNNWHKYLTKDNEYVLFIPKSKYVDLKKPEKVGLNSDTLKKYKQNDLKKQKSRGIIPINSLLNIFKNNTLVEKRVYLTGHGSTEIIANLPLKDYKKLRDKLDQSNCSFFYVASCYGGGVGYEALTLTKEPQLSSKKYIEVLEGIPGYSVRGAKNKITQFFNNINTFFKKYPIKTIRKLSSPNKKYSRNKIKESPLFKTILKDFILRRKYNTPSFRFPGDTKINFLKIGVYGETEIIKEGKKKHRKIKIEKIKEGALRSERLIKIKEDTLQKELANKLKKNILKTKKEISKLPNKEVIDKLLQSIIKEIKEYRKKYPDPTFSKDLKFFTQKIKIIELKKKTLQKEIEKAYQKAENAITEACTLGYELEKPGYKYDKTWEAVRLAKKAIRYIKTNRSYAGKDYSDDLYCLESWLKRRGLTP